MTDELLRYLGVDEVEIVQPENEEVGNVSISDPSTYHFFSCAEFAKNEDESLSLVKEKILSGNILSNVIVEKAGSPQQMPCQPTKNETKIQIQISQPNLQQIELMTPVDGWLMQSFVWYPGWNVYLNEKQVPMELMDYLFRGIKVSAGKNTIQFKYEPASIKMGSWTSLISIFGTMAGFMYLSRRRKVDVNEK